MPLSLPSLPSLFLSFFLSLSLYPHFVFHTLIVMLVLSLCVSGAPFTLWSAENDGGHTHKKGWRGLFSHVHKFKGTFITFVPGMEKELWEDGFIGHVRFNSNSVLHCAVSIAFHQFLVMSMGHWRDSLKKSPAAPTSLIWVKRACQQAPVWVHMSKLQMIVKNGEKTCLKLISVIWRH